MNYGLDLRSTLEKVIRYLILGLAIAVAGFYLPKKGKLSYDELLMLSLTVAATAAVLDTFAPRVSGSFYQGMGLGLGAKTVGFAA